jgi:serine/threonine-protein kinase
MAGPELVPDTTLAGYRILGPVGRGGMGVVYRAEEPALGRLVALKVLAPALADHDEFRHRFLREMRVAASIEHPNILPIYRAGEDRGLLYLAMRYVDASDLREVLRRDGPLEVERALWIVDQVAQALDAAHERGLVHRDVKPANILLTGPDAGARRRVYLVDFGIARPAAVDGSITGTDVVIGTLAYAAPEQLTGGTVDARTDVYALGCVLQECLTGRPPFTAESDHALIVAQLETPPPPPSSVVNGLPVALDRVLARALAKAKDQRFRSCAELVEAARRALAEPTPAPASGAMWQVAPLPVRPPIHAPRPTARSRMSWTAPPGARFQSPVPLADWARRMLWLEIAVAAVGVLANLGDTAAWHRLIGEPTGPGTPSPLSDLVFGAEGLVLLLVAVVFLGWFRRVYRNLEALGARGLRFKAGWAVWGWFVPLLGLFRPKQLLNDVWRASDADLPVDDAGSWRRRSVPGLLTWWWLAFLASVTTRAITTQSVHTLAVLMTFGLLRGPLDLVPPTSGVQSFADLLSVVAGVLALRVVRMTTDRQEVREARLTGRAGRADRAGQAGRAGRMA